MFLLEGLIGNIGIIGKYRFLYVISYAIGIGQDLTNTMK
jgi:hypothetical protein